jgi:hypothetical protein
MEHNDLSTATQQTQAGFAIPASQPSDKAGIFLRRVVQAWGQAHSTQASGFPRMKLGERVNLICRSRCAVGPCCSLYAKGQSKVRSYRPPLLAIWSESPPSILRKWHWIVSSHQPVKVFMEFANLIPAANVTKFSYTASQVVHADHQSAAERNVYLVLDSRKPISVANLFRA